ncbi:MAG: metalloregulator ArsR/SmtB family transcription factor [Candidatus Obscuribacterales bacterium]|nr:metalloregulator ArsR/SmtB family transcription factor [Candidatus Obscuribacterales bacterium]
MPNSELAKFKAEFFKALSSPIRIGILNELREGEKTVSEIRAKLGIELANVSQQLAILKSKNLVSGRKQGNNIYYSCKDPAIFQILDSAKAIFNNHLVIIRDTLETFDLET